MYLYLANWIFWCVILLSFSCCSCLARRVLDLRAGRFRLRLSCTCGWAWTGSVRTICAVCLMGLRRTRQWKGQAFSPLPPSAWCTPVRDLTAHTTGFHTVCLRVIKNSIILHLQWSRSSSWGSTCTRLAVCLRRTAQACQILSPGYFFRLTVKSQRWDIRSLHLTTT